MHRHFYTILFLAFSFWSFSQGNYNSQSMVVSKSDLQGATYEKDSTANAFYIYEKGFSRIENGGKYNLLTDYSAKIKILNKEGFDKSTVEVLLYKNKRGSKEIFRNLIAYTYNLENGKIIKTKLEKEQVYKEKYNENYTLVKFTFPNIKPGSVITYSYQTESPFIFNFKGWNFQDDIPKIHSEYISDLPGNYVYNIRLIGPLKLDVNESTIKKSCIEVSSGGYADCAHNQYIMKDIPAFEEEGYMTAKENYFSRVEYELSESKGFDGVNKKYTTTWKNVDKEFKTEKTIGIQLKKINATKDILPEAIKAMPIGLEKAKAMYTYVIDHYTWNKNYKIFRDVSIKKIIKSNVGNVAEMNILLHNIYKQQGFSVLPVLLSTRKNGYATKVHPVLTDFNYIITQLSIDGNTYLLDATEKSLAFGEIPFRCLNQYGRLMDFKNGSSWIDIKPKGRSSHYYREKLKLENTVLNGHGEYAFRGYHGNYKRRQLHNLSKKKFIDRLLDAGNNLTTVTEANVENENDVEKPFLEKISFTKATEDIDDLIFLKPFARPFFKENPFKLNQRTYPVDFGYEDSYSYQVSIEIPENYEFVDIPKSLNYSLPQKLGRLRLNIQQQGNKLLINHSINFLSSYYPVEYYDSLKEFFNLIVDMENNIVITIQKTS